MLISPDLRDASGYGQEGRGITTADSWGIFCLVPQGGRHPSRVHPSRLHLPRGASLLLPPSPLPRLSEGLPCRAGMATSPPSTGRDCHQHLQPGALSQPAILIMSFLVKSLNGSSLCSQDKSPRPQHSSADTAWDAPSRASSSAACPLLCGSSYPGSDTLLPVLPIRPFLAQQSVYHLGSLICPCRRVRTPPWRSPQHLLERISLLLLHLLSV